MSRRAFTLIEVLLATSLAAVVGLAIAGVLGTLLEAQQRVRARGDQRAVLAAVERRLAADLRAMLPPGGLYAAGLIGEDAPSAAGREPLADPDLLAVLRLAAEAEGVDPPPTDARDRLTLAVLPPAPAFGEEPPLGEGAIWEVVYEIDDDPATPERGLVRRVTRVRDPATGSLPEPPEELSQQVVGLEASYYDAQADAWQETWDSGASDTLPQAISLRLALVHEGALLAYRIVVAPATARPTTLVEPTP